MSDADRYELITYDENDNVLNKIEGTDLLLDMISIQELSPSYQGDEKASNKVKNIIKTVKDYYSEFDELKFIILSTGKKADSK